MNAFIELHDSTLAGIEPRGPDLVVRFRPAYMHRSDGSPGIDPGSGWLQDVDLVIRSAVAEALPSRFPIILADGDFSIGPERWDNELPLPRPLTPGAVLFSALTEDSERVVIRGDAAEVLPVGEPRFLEPFPGFADE